MQARERHRRHFKSSVGSMLNENYGSGSLPDTVSSEDFLYIPTTSLPLSNSALQFLEHKFPEAPAVRSPRASTSESLNNAYFKSVAQPQMMVHYDRDPLFRASKKSLEKDLLGKSDNSYDREAVLAKMEDYARGELVPSNVTPATTPRSVSTAASAAPFSGSSLNAKFRSGSTNSETKAQLMPLSGFKREANSGLNNRICRNKHRLWTPGSEAAGFKPYSPFSDSLYDFGKKQAKFITPEIPEEPEDIPAPNYDDAFQKVMDFGITDAYLKPMGVNILKVHGNPEYPDKVMADKDIPNYVAWTRIFPYCPLTQVEGKTTPVVVPPRGFTPSTAASSPTRLENVAAVKQKILAGIRPEEASLGNSKAGSSSQPQSMRRNVKNIRKSPSLQGLPAPPPPSLASKLLRHQQKLQDKEHQISKATHLRPPGSPAKSFKSSRAPSVLSGHVDVDIPRRLLDKRMGPEEYYTGHTPSHTPTPDYTLPIKPSKAWVNHYSPQRVRHFLAGVTETKVPVG
ncbi:hypothetical protein PoB_005749600 [Plakobranchus ocellatus]|uniref:Uncharacterized protein n=1 Tax=Plakobranchus ocellatus TaxID=259542 RepID=A0AAV4CHS1_9GAST|nr:hypothetical protein PoB_005749600 [Plakobranchus ocellatus]